VAANEVDGDDIDIKVYDADGDLVARDTLPDGQPICRWYVGRAQTYQVQVINASDDLVVYDLATN
jgi:hypothetical protein